MDTRQRAVLHRQSASRVIKRENCCAQHYLACFFCELLNYLFSTNKVHCWHHSSDATKPHQNFGNVFVV